MSIFDQEKHTIGEFITAVMSIEDRQSASAFVEDYLAWLQKQPVESHYPIEEIMRQNIGYCFGEGMAEEKIKMWKEASGAYHPWMQKEMVCLKQNKN